MKATFRKIYYWPGDRRKTISRGRVIIKGSPGMNGELAPEQMMSRKQLDRVHNAIRFTKANVWGDR